MGRPRREGDGHQRRGGAENSHPHQEMVVVRGQEGSDSLQVENDRGMQNPRVLSRGKGG